MPASCTITGACASLELCLCSFFGLFNAVPRRCAFEMMKNVYEIRLKMSGAESSDLLEAEVACFDSAAMVMLGSASTVADLDYSAKVCAWTSDAIRLALMACNKPSAAGRGAPSKKAKEPLQQRRAFLERAQLRLWSLKPELDPTFKKNKSSYAYSLQFVQCSVFTRCAGSSFHRCSSSDCPPLFHAQRRSCRPSSARACPFQTLSRPARSTCRMPRCITCLKRRGPCCAQLLNATPRCRAYRPRTPHCFLPLHR
jgi:hypothetical protein